MTRSRCRKAWNVAEFGVFGDGGGGEANFGSGASLHAVTDVTSMPAQTPTCVDQSFTAETNNLYLNGGPITGGTSLISDQVPTDPGIASSCSGATSWGDTHIITFGQLNYTDQASGQYLLATTGPQFSVQSEQVSSAPQYPGATYNEAVAAHVDASSVAICLPPSQQPPAKVVVNGAVRVLPDGHQINLVGGGSVARDGNSYLIRDTAGDSVTAQAIFPGPTVTSANITALVGLGRTREPVAGLLESPANNSNAVVVHNGPVLIPPFSFAQFYNDYSASWAVPPRESLLTQCGAQLKPVNPTKVMTISDLKATVAKFARTICIKNGVKNTTLQDDCILDVAVLGSHAATVYHELPAKVTFGEILPPHKG
jgi:hypothetical protein